MTDQQPNDGPKLWHASGDPEEPVIPWWLGGAAIGLLLTIGVAVFAPLGMSGEFAMTGGRVLNAVAPATIQGNSYFAKLGISWETVLVIGVILGAALGAMLGRKRAIAVPSVWAGRFGASVAKRCAAAFAGGFILLFGARLAGGCTSGHMISGVSQLALSSFIFAGAIFASGMATARLLFRGGK